MIHNELRKGWRLVLGSAVGAGLGVASLPFYTAGFFIRPIQDDFGWTRAQLGAVNMVVTIGLIAAMPLLAWLLERLDERRVAFASLLCMGLGFATLSQLPDNYPLYLGLFAFIAVIGAGSSPVTFTRLINRTFVQTRGAALGFTLAGLGLAAIFLPIILPRVIADHGWRFGYLTLSAFAIGASPIVAICLPKSDITSPHQAVTRRPNGFIEALRSPVFWLLGLSFSAITMAVSGMAVHFPPMLADRGVAADDVVWLLSLFGLSVLTGRIAVGMLLDRMGALPLGAFLSVIASGCTASLLISDLSVAFAAAIGLGLALGMEIDLASYVTGQIFRIEQYTSAYGALYILIMIASGLGPIVTGSIYDKYESYNYSIILSSLFLLFGSISLFFSDYFVKSTTSFKSLKRGLS